MMENKFEAKETENKQIIAKMKTDFKKDISEQKDFYENMINDQIR